jgi:hypothetical protein
MSMKKTNLELALAVGNNLAALKARLNDAKYVLAVPYRAYFRNAWLDTENKALVGTEGWKLQWRPRLNPTLPESYENQQTNNGCVVLVHCAE